MRATRRSFLVTAAAISAAPATALAQTARTSARAPTLPAPVAPPTNGLQLDPRTFGATGDGQTKDTRAIQAALDRCAVLGGGVVAFAAGTYLVGALRIGSNTTLALDAGATLQGSPDIADYPITQVRWEGRWTPGYIGLIWAEDARNITITGAGKIVASKDIHGRVEQATGLRNPALLEFISVRGLSVSGVTTEQNDMWSIHPVYCEDVTFAHVAIKGGADGIDVDSCRRVVIEHCDFDTGDDCISLKSGRGMEGAALARPTEDVTIRDCTFRDARFQCIGIGSENSAGIRRVLVERCHCLAARTFAIYLKSRVGRGAFLEDVVMRDLDVSGAGQGFLRLNFLDSGKQDQFPIAGPEGIPSVRNVRFERIRVENVPVLVDAASIHPDKPLDGLVLRDISGTATRGATLANMRNVSISGLNVAVSVGPLLAINNVTGRGLSGATQAPATPRPPPVAAADPPYRFGARSERPN